jgi:uncharacterized membrane protein YfcA
MFDPLIIAFGLGVGILIGLTGIGGGSLMTPAAVLRPALGCVLLGSALAVFTKAGVHMPVGVILGVPAAVGLFAWGLHHTRSARIPLPSPERA